jgi:ABC-type protease/lipase transport system fused ATPase/permease subunit
MLIAGSILVGRALQPVELAVGAWKGFSEAKNQYQRLAKLLETMPRQTEKMELPPITGRVSARNASVIPPGERRITLQNVTLDIPAGTVCMVVGPSGAGKSTFLKALLGLWPTAAGEIRVDGTEPSKFDRAAFGPQLGYLPQDIELLEGTVAKNIARFGDIDSEAVIAAAHDAGIHEFVLSLSEGYETELGPLGTQLSPGQRQRVALARALYKNPKLVVLDEPNSNLDESGESALHTAIKKLKDAGSTVVIVSHREGVFPLSDSILVLTAGKVKSFEATTDMLARVEKSKKETQKRLASNKVKPVAQTIPAAGLAPPSVKNANDNVG